MRKELVLLLTLSLFQLNVTARENLRQVFKNNSAIIYTINIRNFASIDKDGNGIIEENKGDTRGTFLNAKNKLKTLKNEGINTIYLLPVTKTGKLKALGTAGSLYAMDSFDEINEQLDDKTNSLSVFEEAKEFVDEAHRLNLNVIADLPACGSYDMSLKNPDWFLSDNNNKNIIPADWSDVRLFKDNEALIENYKKFVDMALNLGIDGIRADVAGIKTPEFWKNIITYTRSKNKNFLFLAEASPDWTNPAEGAIEHYSSVDELLNSGFDAYYGSFSDFKSLSTKTQFNEKIKKNLKILKNHKNSSIIGALATHDQQAPVLRGLNYWNMVLWLNATLPLNSYFLDGFSTGDDYNFGYENKKAAYTLTDDEYYFVHSGMFDIFNLSASSKEKYPQLKASYLKAIDFKIKNRDLISNGTFKLIKTGNEKVFGYSITNKDRELIVLGNLDENNNQNANVKSKYMKRDYLFYVANAINSPLYENAQIKANLEPLELQVYLINLAKYRAQ